MKIVSGTHLAIFFPMPFFRVESINQVLMEYQNNTKFQDLSFYWIPFAQMVELSFNQHYISVFNYQIITYCAEKLLFAMQPTSQKMLDKLDFYPKIAFLNTDGQPHLDMLTETLLMGQYMGGKLGVGSDIERWGFYNAYDFKFPSETELKSIQVIIIPGSHLSVREADNKVT